MEEMKSQEEIPTMKNYLLAVLSTGEARLYPLFLEIDGRYRIMIEAIEPEPDILKE